MGTSVRKTSDKIKKLLKDTMQENPQVSVDIVVPEVAKETIKAKKTKGYFGDKDFVVLAGGGLSCFRKISSIGYEGFVREHECDPQKISVVEIQKIIEAILDDIERENGDIQSSFILNAFKVTMTSVLMDKITDPIVFLARFCEVFLDMIIREDASEELSSAFKGVTPDKSDDAIAKYTKCYVAEHFTDCIEKCTKNEISIAELVAELQKRLK